MEKKFDSTELPLAQLLGDVASGTLQLPDFQRGWVWDDDHIRSLLASISMSYPIGAVMTLRTGNAGVRFAPRPVEGAECGPTEPDLLLLDGQQRVTSLFLALKSRNPVPTRDARGNRIDRHYYVNINAAIDPDCDREEDAIVSVPENRVRTDFRRVVTLDLRTRDKEITAEMFPLDIVLDQRATMDWHMAFVQSGPGPQMEHFEKWKQFQMEFVNPFLEYQVPTIELAKSTRKEAVCQVFEKVNTKGVTLTVFELLTATYAADDFNLRVDWKACSSKFREHKLLDGLRETDFLQVVTLLATNDRRRRHLAANPTDEKAPAVSCKRRDILRLGLDEYRAWADTAADGLERAVPFLHCESIFHWRDLPYATQLIPLGAIFGLLGRKAAAFASQQRLRQWFWCGVFGEMYGGANETRFANDLQDCVAWTRDGGDIPRTVRDAQFQAERLLTLRTRNSAAYKGLYALQMRRGSRDFQTGAPIDVNAYVEHAIDIHHVFPRRWCENQRNVEIDRVADCAVNKTAVGAHTNRFIGGNAPSVYLRRIEAHDGIDSQELDGLLRSHDIDPAALRRDDFASFFNHRFERLLRQIEAAMGKPVNRNEHQDESPFVDATGGRDLDDVKALLQAGETQTVEFKSTGRKNLHTGEKDTAMEWSVIKSICAFLNAQGGTLLIGTDDAGEPVGIEEDYPFVKSGNRDGWERWLTDLVSRSLGQVAVTDLDVRFAVIDGRTVACIHVRPGAQPVFATTLKGGKRDVFFVRLNNSTEELAGQALLDYQKKHWPA